MQNRYREIIAIFTLIQLIVLGIFGYTPYPDSEGYIRLANDCLVFNQPYPISQKISELQFIWNPGPINLTALSLILFDSIIPLLIFYCLLKGVTAWLIHDLTLKLLGARIAFVTLLLYVIYPANYGESTSLLSEIPSFFFSILGIWLTVCKDKPWLGGAAIAIGNWFRPMGIIYLLALLLYRKRHSFKIIAGYTIMICVIGGTCYLRTNHFIYQAKTGWMALLQYSVDHTLTTEDDSLPYITNANAVEKDKIWRNRFILWIAKHPQEYLLQIPKKIVDLYISDNVNLCAFLSNKEQRPYLYDELSMRTLIRDFPKYTPTQTLAIINLIYYYFLLITFVVATVRICSQKIESWFIIPITVIIATTTMLALVGHGEARFHHTLMPFIIMIGAVVLTPKITSRNTAP